MHVGVLGISRYRRSRAMMFLGYCAHGVMCVCCCRYQQGLWQGGGDGSGCERVMWVCAGVYGKGTRDMGRLWDVLCRVRDRVDELCLWLCLCIRGWLQGRMGGEVCQRTEPV